VQNSFKPSSIEQGRIEIQRKIKKIFDKWNRFLIEIISTFDRDHLKDKNRHVRKAIKSLRQLLASGFD